MVAGLWYTNDPKLGSLSWFWRCKDHPFPLSPNWGLWRILEVPDWGLAFWSWLGYGDLSLNQGYSKFWIPILILKMQKHPRSLGPHVALKDDGDSWLGFDSWILIWILSLVCDTSMIQVLALYLQFEWFYLLSILRNMLTPCFGWVRLGVRLGVRVQLRLMISWG